MTENITFVEVPLIEGEIEQEQPTCILSYNRKEIFERKPNSPATLKDRNEASLNGNEEGNSRGVNGKAKSPSRKDRGGRSWHSSPRRTSTELEILKTAFSLTPTPTRHVFEQIANRTGLPMRVIKVWFQNERSRERRRLKQHTSTELKPLKFRGSPLRSELDANDARPRLRPYIDSKLVDKFGPHSPPLHHAPFAGGFPSSQGPPPVNFLAFGGGTDMLSSSVSRLDGVKQLKRGDIHPTIVLENLKRDVIEEVTAGIWRCGSCGKTENSFLMLDLHENTGCEELSRIECDMCPVVTNDYFNFVAHFMEHKMGRKKKCPICLHENIDDMKQHLVLQGHYVPKMSELDLQMNTSLVLPQKLSKLTRLQTQMTIHNSKKVHECNICKKSFSSKQYLRLHQRTHSGEKLFDCKICGKTFIYEKSRNIHLRIHSGDKPYKCLVCSKKFNQICNLKRHMVTHNSEDRHECNTCKKIFSSKKYLGLHQRTHSGEILFDCKICGKTFINEKSRNIHLKKCVEKPFECKICNKTFAYKHTRNFHLRIHSGEKPHKCHVCNTKFNHKGNLKRHRISIHSDELCN
ncbi:zinc finger protein OZF-like isoform X2 [Artemia franciscana]|uniref:zinc finger protein OZF-like isoform X2 n=1 Tax=Artemia franciscana TaxID=6661 RepID=UPI0032DB930E